MVRGIMGRGERITRLCLALCACVCVSIAVSIVHVVNDALYRYGPQSTPPEAPMAACDEEAALDASYCAGDDDVIDDDAGEDSREHNDDTAMAADLVDDMDSVEVGDADVVDAGARESTADVEGTAAADALDDDSTSRNAEPSPSPAFDRDAVDGALRRAFVAALRTRVSDDMLPMAASTLLSDHMSAVHVRCCCRCFCHLRCGDNARRM